MPKFIDITGQKFGRLTVLERANDNKHKQVRWHCECDCGKKATVTAMNLRSGKSGSCGCLSRERVTTHGHTVGGKRSPTRHSWQAMWDRCTRSNHPAYDRYKDLPIDPRWRDFREFLADMGERPPGTSLDRIDNLRFGYCKSNCRWADARTQQNNRCNNRRLSFNGREMTMKEWSREVGIGYTTLKERLCRGWSVQDALTTPVRRKLPTPCPPPLAEARD